MYCVDCGKEKPIFRKGSCLSCYLQHHHFTEGPNLFHIPMCSYCDSFKYKNTWKNETLEETIKHYIKNTFRISAELRNVKISLDCHDEEDSIFCKVNIIGFVENVEIAEDHYIEIRLKPNVCDVCSKKFGGYHEAIIQIRPDQRKLLDEKRNQIQEFVKHVITSLINQGNRKLFLTDMGVEHGGVDFLLSDKQAAFAIVKRIQEKFGGEIQVSSKNIGMKDGKQVHRYTYLLRLLPFDPDDVFKFHDEYFIVQSIKGNQLHIVKLQDWSDMLVQGKNIDQAVFIGPAEDLSFHAILVNETNHDVQLMHPRSYTIFFVKKPTPDFSYSEQSQVIQINDSFFIKPE